MSDRCTCHLRYSQYVIAKFPFFSSKHLHDSTGGKRLKIEERTLVAKELVTLGNENKNKSGTRFAYTMSINFCKRLQLSIFFDVWYFEYLSSMSVVISKCSCNLLPLLPIFHSWEVLWKYTLYWHYMLLTLPRIVNEKT